MRLQDKPKMGSALGEMTHWTVFTLPRRLPGLFDQRPVKEAKQRVAFARPLNKNRKLFALRWKDRLYRYRLGRVFDMQNVASGVGFQ